MKSSVRDHKGAFDPVETWELKPGLIPLLLWIFPHGFSTSDTEMTFISVSFLIWVSYILVTFSCKLRCKAEGWLRHACVFPLQLFVFACVSYMLRGSPHTLAVTQLKSSGTVHTHPSGTSSAPEFPSPSRLRASIFISSTDLGKMMKGWLFSHLLFPAKVACISMRRKSAKTCKHVPIWTRPVPCY